MSMAINLQNEERDEDDIEFAETDALLNEQRQNDAFRGPITICESLQFLKWFPLLFLRSFYVAEFILFDLE